MTTSLKIVRNGVLTGSAVLAAYLVAFAAACALLPADSLMLTVVSDVGFVALELGVLILCFLAFGRSAQSRDRWVWGLVAAWLAFNIFADTTWAVYEISGREVPNPGLPDLGYLASYAAGIGAVLVAAWHVCGRMRTVEAFLDATMFTIGAAGLSWPLLIGPLLEVGGAGAAYWLGLVYPVADLLILFAFVSFFLRLQDSVAKPSALYVVLCVSFLVQTVADTGYMMITAAGGEYGPGSWLDPVWLLSFAVAGVAALIGIRTPAGAEERRQAAVHRGAKPGRFGSSRWRVLIPYLGLPIVAAILLTTLRDDGWAWTTETRVLAYLGFVLVGLLLVRQYVTLAQNRVLNASLTFTSRELKEKVDDLADLNERLEMLNGRSHQLNSLHDVHSVAEVGLEVACAVARSAAGWITIKDDEGKEATIAARGRAEYSRPDDPRTDPGQFAPGVLHAVSLRTRGEDLGTLWLERPGATGRGPDLLPGIAAHIATAIDNARRYEEALHLAERDPLTGLFNHRGIHKRLAGESLRAQQSGTELALIMLDLDDFKLLNDTYGHPVGDAVLRYVSDAIRAVMRHADLAGRVGGDELLIVLPNTGTKGALQLCERLREKVSGSPFVSDAGESIPVRASFGVASSPAHAASLGQLIEIADANLYASKEQGGNTITAGSPGPVADSSPGAQAAVGKVLAAVGAHERHLRRHSRPKTEDVTARVEAG